MHCSSLAPASQIHGCTCAPANTGPADGVVRDRDPSRHDRRRAWRSRRWGPPRGRRSARRHRTPKRRVTSRSSTVTFSGMPAASPGRTTRMSASPPEITSARLDSTSIRTLSVAACAGADSASAATARPAPHAARPAPFALIPACRQWSRSRAGLSLDEVTKVVRMDCANERRAGHGRKPRWWGIDRTGGRLRTITRGNFLANFAHFAAHLSRDGARRDPVHRGQRDDRPGCRRASPSRAACGRSSSRAPRRAPRSPCATRRRARRDHHGEPPRRRDLLQGEAGRAATGSARWAARLPAPSPSTRRPPRPGTPRCTTRRSRTRATAT